MINEIERDKYMQIHNTASYFLEHFTPTEEFLKHYHEKFAPHFKEYFLYHCRNVDEKMKNAIKKLPNQLEEIKSSSRKIEQLIQQVVNSYEEKYNVHFTKDVHIIVGLYGSNAFVQREVIPDVTFCLERLSSKNDHLKVIIAHEFGHVLHGILTDREEINWAEVDWSHPYTGLLQEGSATYFSKQVIQVDDIVYFTYGETDDEWLTFAKNNESKLVTAFLYDVKYSSREEVFREWFSINGGKRFGYTRMAYYIGNLVVERLIEKHGEIRAITLWREPAFIEEIEEALKSFL